MELILVIDADWLYQTYPYSSVSHNMKTISAKYLAMLIFLKADLFGGGHVQSGNKGTFKSVRYSIFYWQL
jgi:hypothetical protein